MSDRQIEGAIVIGLLLDLVGGFRGFNENMETWKPKPGLTPEALVTRYKIEAQERRERRNVKRLQSWRGST